jgi:hypothetical protein
LEEMSEELGEPVVFIGDPGISYAPTRYLDFVEGVFVDSGLDLLAVELAPVAASRMFGSLPSGAMTLGSGVAWSARILHDHVLEAFESEGPFDEVVHVAARGAPRPLGALAGVDVDERLCQTRRVSAGALAPAVGAALSLLGPPRTNLLYGESTYGPLGSYPGSDLVSAASPRAPDRGIDEDSGNGESARRKESGRFNPSETYQLQRFSGSAPSDRSDVRPPDRSDVRLSDRSDVRPKARRESASRPSPFDDDLVADESSSSAFDDLAGIEAFAHPGEPPPRSFSFTDFLLGALVMLAIVLVVWLVLL